MLSHIRRVVRRLVSAPAFASAAILTPARRASRVAPARGLRQE